MILADFHTHSCFSGDSSASPRQQIQAAIDAGLRHLCFTDHQDPDYTDGEIPFVFDTEAYFQTMRPLKQQYRGQIDLSIGVELGLQPHLSKTLPEYAASYPFDYIIGSTHVVDGLDPYYPRYWQQHSGEEGILRYYEWTLKNVQTFDCFDCYGHLDYIVRYAPGQRQSYSWRRYADLVDEILKTLIQRGKGIECNTAGFAHGLGHPNPEESILRRYMELGGELLTIGSDGHTPERIAFGFDRLPDLLKRCGVRYYTVFTNRTPQWIPL